jgi:hypothetical protein
MVTATAMQITEQHKRDLLQFAANDLLPYCCNAPNPAANSRKLIGDGQRRQEVAPCLR